MRVYTSVTIDISSGKTVAEESYNYNGPVAFAKGGSGGGSSAGGGSGAGEIGYPVYMEDRHKDLLDDLIPEVDIVRVASPYEDAVSYDPTIKLAEIKLRYDSLAAAVDRLNPKRDLEGFINTASNIAEQQKLLGEGPVAEVVSNFESRQAITHARVLNRFNGAMADINAVQSSAFVIGQALIESQLQNSVDGVSADLSFRNFHMRAQFMAQVTSEFMSLTSFSIDTNRMLTSLLAEINRVTILAEKEQHDNDLRIDIDDSLWGLRTFAFAGNMLSAISGSTSLPEFGSPNDSTLGGSNVTPVQGAASGAVAGATIGASTGNPYGAAAGAVIGGIGGYFASGN